ncbi:hypothetical protein GCM10009603_27560 [Nocardiopsis exhalans]
MRFPAASTSALAVAEALAGLPWVLCEREPVPEHVEHGLRLLAEPQENSPVRRYVWDTWSTAPRLAGHLSGNNGEHENRR